MYPRGSLRQAFMAALVLVALTSAVHVRADEPYPSRPIQLIVPWGVGGGSDQLARIVAKLLERELKVSVPVVNAPGATGNAGITKLIDDSPDGYSIAVFASDTFYDNLIKDAEGHGARWKFTDITPLAIMNQQPLAFFVAGDSKFKSWQDIESAARASTGEAVKVATDGFDGAEDTLVKQFIDAGLKLTEVPYAKPGERYSAVLGGHVDVMCDPTGNARAYVASGQMRPVLIFDTKRFPGAMFGNVPTSIESGYDLAIGESRAIIVRRGTDPKRVKLLSAALSRVYRTEEFQAYLRDSLSIPDSFVSMENASKFYATKRAAYLKLLQKMKANKGGS